MAGAAELAGVRVVVEAVEAADAKELLELSDAVRQRLGDAAVVLGCAVEGRVHLVANVAPAAVERGVKAGDVVRAAAQVAGGGGGGRDTMAQAGGRDPEKLPEALATARLHDRAGRSAMAQRSLGPRSRRRSLRLRGLRSDPGRWRRRWPRWSGRTPAAGWRRSRGWSPEQGAERVVVGLPLTLAGEEGEQAARARAFAEQLRRRLSVPVELHDERLTTKLAERAGGSADADSRAAAHLLESYLARLPAGTPE